MDTIFECAVVGGGAAGLSAALVLGRARRRTLVVDAGDQSNLPAHGIGGLLGHDGRPPAEFYAAAHRELAAYPSVELRRGTVVAGERDDDGFSLTLSDGGHVGARRVLLATGMDYRPPELAGIAERWGHSVFHCPFCHGWEVRDRPLAVLDDGETGVHRATLLRVWSDRVTLLTNGPSPLAPQDADRLRAGGITIDERPIARLRGPGAELEAVVFADGTELACEGLLAPVTLHQRSALAEQLGAATAPTGPLTSEAIVVDGQFATDAPGVAAAGDVTGRMPSVANAIAAGSTAAAMIVGAIAEEALERVPSQI
jgi:thioredoxin reductase